MDVGITISSLVERFEHYAIKLKEIKHTPGTKGQEAFFNVDLEALQNALSTQAKFPAVFLQTPETNKAGSYDNVDEAFSFTFVVVVSGKDKKAVLFDRAKKLSDKIFNRLQFDIAEGVILCSIEGSDEGYFGPVSDKIYGWAVSCTLTAPYNAAVDRNDWEDLL